jgi:hypothetical protein
MIAARNEKAPPDRPEKLTRERSFETAGLCVPVRLRDTQERP